MKRIAITGGIAEGKSTVLGYCSEAGFSTCSADEIAREVLSSHDLQDQIASIFDLPIPLDVALVREKIAENAFLRRWLNAVTHTPIARALLACQAQIIEVPLLLETCMQASFERIWVVTCGPEQQFARLVGRVGDVQARQLLSSQLPTESKTPFADRIIRTNEPEQHVKQVVLACLDAEFGAASN